MLKIHGEWHASEVTKLLSSAAKQRCWQSVFGILEELVTKRLRGNIIIYNAAANALGKGSKWRLSLFMLCEAARKGCVANEISQNLLLSALERAACWTRGIELLGASSNAISFNTALKGCAKGWLKALEVFTTMRLSGSEPDAFTFSALAQTHSWLMACYFLDQAGSQANLVTYSAAMSACQGSAQWQQAMILFSRLLSKGLLPNVISYSAAVSACEKGGQWQRALALFAEMPRFELYPDAVACGAALRACEVGLQWQLILDLLKGMQGLMLKPDSVCFTSAIATCSKAGQWDEILKLVESMLDLEVKDFSIARYEHSSQAGSTLDCFKHSVLVMLMKLFTSSSESLTYIDTHAGIGLYDPTMQRGIKRLQEEPVASSLDGYLRAESAHGKYLGSPLLAARWLRPQDKAMFFELSKDASEKLKENMKEHCRALDAELREEDSYWHLVHRSSNDRAFILIDPPYDPYETYMAWNFFLLRSLYEKWPRSTLILWPLGLLRSFCRPSELLIFTSSQFKSRGFGVQHATRIPIEAY